MYKTAVVYNSYIINITYIGKGNIINLLPADCTNNAENNSKTRCFVSRERTAMGILQREWEQQRNFCDEDWNSDFDIRRTANCVAV